MFCSNLLCRVSFRVSIAGGIIDPGRRRCAAVGRRAGVDQRGQGRLVACDPAAIDPHPLASGGEQCSGGSDFDQGW